MKLFYQALAIFALAFCFNAAGTTALPLMDRDEPRFAEAAREMRQSGDFLIPTFNNEPRYHKPPLLTWCQAASYGIFGENDFAARFPSILAGALTSLLVFGFGRRLYNEHAGFWAAAAFTLCPQNFILAKAATADMLLVFFITAAFWAGWERRWFLFYASLALAFLAKGPVGLLPLAAVWLREKRLHPKGLFFLILLIALWAVPAVWKSQGEYIRVGIGKHIVERSLNIMDSHGAKDFLGYVVTLPYYFALFFVSFFPWAFFLAPSLWKKWREKIPWSPNERALLLAALLIFLVFTPLRTKLPHYTFPAFPLIAIFLAGSCLQREQALKPFRISLGLMAAFLLGIALAGFSVAAQFFPSPKLARVSAPWLKPEMEFASMGFNEPSLVWYFRKYVKGWHHSTLNEEQMAKFMNQAGPRFCILPKEVKNRLFPVIPDGWKALEAKGINLAKGKHMDLVVLIKLN